MRISRQTETELVVEDSGLWITVLLAIASAPLFYAAALPGKHGNVITALFFLICSLAFLRRSKFVFDATQQALRWNRLRFFKSSSGVIPFSEITAVTTESTSGRSSGSRIYRLTVATKHGTIPMTDTYGPGRGTYASVRDSIMTFLGRELPPPGREPRRLSR
jgi:hypothetical protein